jgi:predicted TIM-barrel fold metal-dependent hydrolase
MGRICHRFPKLKFVSVESGVGFLPYLVDALDWQFLNNNLYRDYPDMMLPSDYFRRQIYGTFWFEKDVAHLAKMFPDNLMFESDYPHMTSLTPGDNYPYVRGPRDTLIANVADDIPEDVLVKLVRDNARRVYNLA